MRRYPAHWSQVRHQPQHQGPSSLVIALTVIEVCGALMLVRKKESGNLFLYYKYKFIIKNIKIKNKINNLFNFSIKF